jgi:hypothetical protein
MFEVFSSKKEAAQSEFYRKRGEKGQGEAIASQACSKLSEQRHRCGGGNVA